MDNTEIKDKISRIIISLEEKGYEPIKQLESYIQENDIRYITRHNNARELVQELDISEIEFYIRDNNLI